MADGKVTIGLDTRALDAVARVQCSAKTCANHTLNNQYSFKGSFTCNLKRIHINEDGSCSGYRGEQ
jgi:hypothetical protein